MSRRPSRAEMREMAAASDRAAERCLSNARSAKKDAADPTLSDTVRKQAAATVRIARNHAQEYRDDAAKLREGYLPGEDW